MRSLKKVRKEEKKFPTLNGDVVATGGSNSRTGVADIFRDFVFGCPDLSRSRFDRHVDVFDSGGSFSIGDEVNVGELVEEVEVGDTDLVGPYLSCRCLESEEVVDEQGFGDVSSDVRRVPSRPSTPSITSGVTSAALVTASPVPTASSSPSSAVPSSITISSVPPPITPIVVVVLPQPSIKRAIPS